MGTPPYDTARPPGLLLRSINMYIALPLLFFEEDGWCGRKRLMNFIILLFLSRRVDPNVG